MKHRLKHVFCLLLPLLLFSCRENEVSLLDRLNSLPGITATVITPPQGFIEAFQIDISQPIDHDAPSQGSFSQRLYLSHRDENAPTVFFTTGYGVSRNSERELTALMNANQILLVHRFFPDARPVPLDWSKLTIRQAAADQHRIRTILGSIYSGKWVSSGGSKGGMTALFYKRFYPDDVDATVAYVAPIMGQPDDPRFAPFLQRLGSSACRQKITAFQREVLKRRQEMLNLLQVHAAARGYTFSRIGSEAALEYSVLEYPFAFWQYGSAENCSLIPTSDQSDQAVFDHLAATSPFSYYSDTEIEYYEPLFYQAYTEIGYCPYIHDHLADLLQVLDTPSYQAFAPQVQMDFNSAVMAELIPWLRYQGERIIYIYGGINPWSAAALEPDDSLDCLFILQAGANHQVQIRSLDERGRLVDTLNRWLDTSIPATFLQTLTPSVQPDRYGRF